MRRILILLLVLAGSAFSQRPATGGYPGAFARLGSNARDVALGGALVADVNTGFLALTNPASLVYHQRREAGLSYLALPLGRSVQSVGLAFALPPTAAAGITYLRAGDDDIQARNSIGERLGTVSYSEQQIGLSFSNRLSAHISMGLTAKYLVQTLVDEVSRGFGIDLGLMYRRPSGLSAALRVENVTGAYNWKIDDAENSRDYVERLPVIFSLATRVPVRHYTIFAQADAIMPEQGGVVNIFRAAIEDHIGDRLFVRAGLNHLTPTAGVGLLFSIWDPLDSHLDYSLSLGRAGEGLGHLFSWVFTR
jgi:hypothetical protein